MPLVRSPRTPRDPYSVAARARSVLACPSAADLRRDGLPVDLAEEVLGLDDDSGRPTLLCRADAALLTTAARREVVSLHLTSGVDVGDPVRADQLHVTGRLALGAAERCGSCPDEHRVAVLEPSAVVLTVRGRSTPVPVADFLSDEHVLNRGYLARAVQHATTCHGEELRRAVSRRTGLPPARLLAASLDALTPAGVDLHWIDAEGAHSERVRFDPPAATPAELGELLRRHLDGGVC